MRYKKKATVFTECNIDLWRNRITQEVIKHFAKEKIKLEKTNVNLVSVYRTARGQSPKMFLAEAWVYPNRETRHHLRIEIKPRRFGFGQKLKIDVVITETLVMPSALQEYKKTWFIFR